MGIYNVMRKLITALCLSLTMTVNTYAGITFGKRPTVDFLCEVVREELSEHSFMCFGHSKVLIKVLEKFNYECALYRIGDHFFVWVKDIGL